MMVASLAYYAWAAAGAFQERALSAAVRSVAVNLLAYITYMLVLVVVGVAVGLAVLIRKG